MSRVRDIANILSGSTDMATDAEVAALYAPLSNPTFTAIGGDEGGQINLAAAATNTTLSGNVALDINQNRLRIFETGGSNRGYYLDISSGGNGVATNLGSSGGMTLISSQTPSAASSITFGSISGSYKQLLLTWAHLSHSTGSGTNFSLRFNNDSGSNYAIFGDGYTSGNITTTVTNTFACYGANNNSFGSGVTTTAAIDTIRGSCLIDNYSSSTLWKQYSMTYAYFDTQLTGQRKHIWIDGQYTTTTAITSVDIVRTSGTGTISAQSGGYVRLYGIS